MIPELGNFAIILALCFAIIQGAAPLRIFKHENISHQLSRTAAVGQFIFLSFAMICLIASFINDDMSVIYVREHSHTLLPFIYRVGAAWGGHEGSLLLWCLILAAWTFTFILFADKKLSSISRSHIIMILGFISCGFILFLLMTSNPFQRDFPKTFIAGNDLTPILQDPGLIFHPPMLYLGYVGFAIGFAFAISALIEGKLSAEWARACRPWIILPWSFLSCGIVLGSWWAYRELGWGGWWFWDPVENASLLPWLSATALLHSLIVSEKRQCFKGWTLLLAIITFALSLLGTFLVRSGVLVSVHAFANDPTRGIFLLCYLALIIGSAFLLYGIRIKDFYQAPQFELLSRETFLLLNSVVLLTAVFTIVIGTLYPIILDALNLGKISVGEPYFNTVFMPIILPLLLLMGFAPHLSWKQQAIIDLIKKLWITILSSLMIAVLVPKLLGFQFYWLSLFGIFFAVWIILATLQYAYLLWKSRKHVELQHASMIVAHMGIAILALGVTVNKSYSTERQVKILPGENISLAGYQFTFVNIDEKRGANYEAVIATFDVQKNNNVPEKLEAEQRIYKSNQETLSKPGILVNPFRDLYLALGNGFPDGGWSVRIYYKPFVRWIWAGGFLLLIGGFLSLLNYWKKRDAKYL
ncbi:MAG TPA: heme lyase CcmF/NrfE family subunit [Gammaproteobacteria bacterium]|nr:heme lyase CcmF/NrfE family subunit [Gammaproteobacteria bacterium]